MSTTEIPEMILPLACFEVGMSVGWLLTVEGLTESESSARRLVQQSAVCVNGVKLKDADSILTRIYIQDSAISLQIGTGPNHRYRVV